MTEAQVKGSVIPETVPIEGIASEAAVLEGATTETEVPVAPEPTEEVHDDALPEASMDVVVRSPEIQDVESIRGRRRLVVAGWSFCQMTSLTRRWWPGTWR
jgi:hypothetical protein